MRFHGAIPRRPRAEYRLRAKDPFIKETRMLAIALALIVGFALPASSQEPDVKHELIDYKHGDIVLQGYMAWNPAVAGKRPGVIIFHEWKGHGDYVRRR